jgi:hypothetical protein
MHALGSTRPPGRVLAALTGASAMASVLVAAGCGQPRLRPVRRPALAIGRPAANAVLEFLRLPQLDASDLPPVRYRKQADCLTERYADLIRSAISSAG